MDLVQLCPWLAQLRLRVFKLRLKLVLLTASLVNSHLELVNLNKQLDNIVKQVFPKTQVAENKNTNNFLHPSLSQFLMHFHKWRFTIWESLNNCAWKLCLKVVPGSCGKMCNHLVSYKYIHAQSYKCAMSDLYLRFHRMQFHLVVCDFSFVKLFFLLVFLFSSVPLLPQLVDLLVSVC